MLLLYLLLIVVPIAGYFFSRRRYPKRVGLITGICFGLVISPLGYGFYGLSAIASVYIHPTIGVLLVLLSGIILFFQGAAGHKIAIWLGIQTPATVVSGTDHLWIEMINGLLWGSIYGVIGLFVDKARRE
jgi:hypothetical protein